MKISGARMGRGRRSIGPWPGTGPTMWATVPATPPSATTPQRIRTATVAHEPPLLRPEQRQVEDTSDHGEAGDENAVQLGSHRVP